MFLIVIFVRIYYFLPSVFGHVAVYVLILPFDCVKDLGVKAVNCVFIAMLIS